MVLAFKGLKSVWEINITITECVRAILEGQANGMRVLALLDFGRSITELVIFELSLRKKCSQQKEPPEECFFGGSGEVFRMAVYQQVIP